MHLLVDLVVVAMEDVDHLLLELEDEGDGSVVEAMLVAVAVLLSAGEVEDEVSAIRGQLLNLEERFVLS